MCIYVHIHTFTHIHIYVYLDKKTKECFGFSKTLLKIANNYLIENCYLNVRNVIMKQSVGIPMRMDPAPLWVNRFLYSHKKQYIISLVSSDKISSRNFLLSKRFLDGF